LNETQCVELATGVLTVEIREAAFPLDELCAFAARNNRKRGFLFVSKVLGKHWPASPSMIRRVHEYLAERIHVKAGPVVFIAMAETATGLGQGVFEAFLERQCRNDGLFLHTTRHRVPGREFLNVEETHTHAPDLYLYRPLAADHDALFCSARTLVVIDDEISTGSTLCNLVNAYRRCNRHLERVHFVAITDFSGLNSTTRFSARVGLPVDCIAVLYGAFTFQARESALAETPPPATGDNRCKPGTLADDVGRFGTTSPLRCHAGHLRAFAEGLESGTRVLVLGTGEFMHAAFRLGFSLEAMGFQVAVQATTRSPILVGSGVVRRLAFPDNYGEGIANYLYNVAPEDYARAIVCHETPPVEGLRELARRLGDCVLYRFPPRSGTFTPSIIIYRRITHEFPKFSGQSEAKSGRTQKRGAQIQEPGFPECGHGGFGADCDG